MACIVRYHQNTDMGLVRRQGELVSAKTSDGTEVEAVLERQYDGWNFTHPSTGFSICKFDLKTKKAALTRFAKAVFEKSAEDFEKGERKAREHPEFQDVPPLEQIPS